MAFSEYVLLVSLSAGIHAHADTGGISIGPEAITQPNGGVSAEAFKVAEVKYKGITATSAQKWIGPTQPSPQGRDLGTVGGSRYNWNTVPSLKGAATTIPTGQPVTRPPTPTFRSPAIRVR